jgi:opacity protein-like surface antigen
MVFKKVPFIFLLAPFLVLILPAASQVIPAGQEGKLPLSVGAGASAFHLDWGEDSNGHRRPIWGGTLWIDWHFYGLPRYLNGLGIEVEARDVSKFGPRELSKGYGDWNCTDGEVQPNCQPNPSGLREDTAEGGVIYTWRRYAKFHPYGKFLFGFGSMDFPAGDAFLRSGAPYTHDTRTIYGPGGGLEYRFNRKVDIRADYEYQFWPDFLGHPHALNPNGISVGATYSFKPYHHHTHTP